MNKQQSMDGKSQDLKAEKLEALKQQFPELFSEGKLDVEKLRQSLDENLVAGDERYRLEWAGKHRVFEEIAKRTTATLTPDVERSVDFDTSRNVFIEGENLEVLRVLQKAYYNKVKMIYIDPPYNTGNDFVYNDNFRETAAEYDEAAGNLDENGNLAKAFTLNSKDSGQYHSNWLNMMYPRLFLARNLLREDGVIFVSIDDNEVHNLRMLMNEIFGEENFVESIVWNKRIPKNDKGIGNIHEYILVYAKDVASKPVFKLPKDGLNEVYEFVEGLKKKGVSTDEAEKGLKRFYSKKGFDRGITLYSQLDEEYKIWGKINLSWPNGTSMGSKYEVLHPLTKKPVKIPDRGWRWTKETFDEYYSGSCKKLYDGSVICGKIWFAADENTQPSLVKYLDEVSDLLLKSIISLKSSGGIETEALLGQNIFSYPKPVNLLKTFIESITRESDLIFDFFGGSATMAHAVMQQNSMDSGSRKFICVQLPEATPEDSEARKAGYETIADIAIERIKRAAKKIKEENPEYTGDLGVKVYKQTPSHFPAWRAESFESDEALQLSLGGFVEQKAVGEAGARAVELLLKLGYDVNTPLEEKDGYYSAAKGEMLLVVDEKAKVDLEKLLTEKPSVVVILEDLFKSDDAKINFALACKEKNVTFQTV